MEEIMVLGRIGHYFTPSSSEGEDVAGSCQTAVVAYAEDGENGQQVNLDVLTHTAEHLRRLSVPVAAPAHGEASFHLTRSCPWDR